MKHAAKLGWTVLQLCVLGLSTGCFSGDPASGSAGLSTDDQIGVLAGKQRCLTPEDSKRMADQVIQLVNLERASADMNLSPVVVNDRLMSITGEYACRLIEADFFAHHDPESGRGPKDRAVAGKYAFYAVGENLAAGPETPAEVMQSWMDSPPHREVILDPKWTEIGIGVRDGGRYSTYWVLLLGDPALSR